MPKLCGADVEVGNFILGVYRSNGTGAEASRLLLRRVEGLPRTSRWFDNGRPYNPQDVGRKFLRRNGGCLYIDLDHLELCPPEVLSAYDHLAACHAMLRIADEARVRANDYLPEGQKIQVLVNNSDGQNNSYGSHLNFLITRRAWDNIFERKMHHLLYLAAYQVSSIVFAGQGKVGSENGAPDAPFQLSQRADFFETLTGPQTTFNRPIVNSRDEPLCGPPSWAASRQVGSALARLHCIFYDSNLCHVAHLLKVGVMQIILAMIEVERINPAFILDDPVDAVARWSHDPTLRTRARMASGLELTAVELQMMFLEQAKPFVEAGECEGIVPRADEILALWEDTLLKLQRGDLAALMPRLDWALKWSILHQAMRQRPDLHWDSPEVKHLDHLYSSLDPSEGLYWVYERSGLVERMVSEEDIVRFMDNPPEDTRAFTRAMLLRQAGTDTVEIEDVDWDFIRFRCKPRAWHWSTYRTLRLSSPLAFTRAHTAHWFQEENSLDEILDGLETQSADADTRREQTLCRSITDGVTETSEQKTLPFEMTTVTSYSIPHTAEGGDEDNNDNDTKGGDDDDAA